MFRGSVGCRHRRRPRATPTIPPANQPKPAVDQPPTRSEGVSDVVIGEGRGRRRRSLQPTNPTHTPKRARFNPNLPNAEIETVNGKHVQRECRMSSSAKAEGDADDPSSQPTPWPRTTNPNNETTEREGFEPSNEVNPRYTISNRAHSTTLAPLLVRQSLATGAGCQIRHSPLARTRVSLPSVLTACVSTSWLPNMKSTWMPEVFARP